MNVRGTGLQTDSPQSRMVTDGRLTPSHQSTAFVTIVQPPPNFCNELW